MRAGRRKFVNLSGAWSILAGVEEVAAGGAELVALAVDGEPDALAGLFEHYRASLYASAIALLRDRDDALDAVQETFVVALVRLGSLRDPAAVGGWLHAVLRNCCLMRLRRAGREAPSDHVEPAAVDAGLEDALDHHALRDWLWAALDALSPEDRLTVVLRHFSRCQTYEAIAAVSGAPVGTVRSRLHRARSQLGDRLRSTVGSSTFAQADLERQRRQEWEDFYATLHEAPVPRTYRATYEPGIEVTDGVGRWRGIEEWSAHEREAIALGVRARIIGLIAGRDVTILEIDFTNPAWAADHCPPRSTFVHRLDGGRSRRLDIHYV
jgi:RNA polymerase sigma-70 factor (ECF subfamily)